MPISELIFVTQRQQSETIRLDCSFVEERLDIVVVVASFIAVVAVVMTNWLPVAAQTSNLESLEPLERRKLLLNEVPQFIEVNPRQVSQD